MKPHKHCDLIIAWANGAEIQDRYKFGYGDWTDVVKYGCIELQDVGCAFTYNYMKHDNLKLTFDGETGELKLAEVLK